MKKILLLGALVAFFGLPAEAFGQRRIREGVRSGHITREEARNLRAQRREIRRDRRDYRRQLRREWRDDDRRRSDYYGRNRSHYGRDYDNYRGADRRRGNGYYRRGAGSPSHPVFGINGKRNRRWR